MMLQRFLQFVEGQHLIPDGGEVLLAVSGGRDSVCMTHLFHRAGLPFAIAHCNFHLRPGECDRDQQLVERLAQHLGVPCHVTHFDTRAYAAAHSQSIEEAARQLRYRYFAALCREHHYCAVATAHHRDDSIETFFLNLLRGTGIAGLHGIRPRSMHEVPVIHPLLPFSRQEISQYVAEQRLPFVDDSTNALLDARRNQLRLRVLPLLRELYPSFDSTMEANIERLTDTEQLFDARLDQLRSELLQPVAPRVPTAEQPLLAITLAAVPEPRRTVLFELLRPYGLNAAAVDDLLRAPLRTGMRFLSPSHEAVVDRGRLLLAPLADPAPLRIEEQPVEIENLVLPDGRRAIVVDADRLRRPLSLRPWQPADRFHPFGMEQSRLVSDFLKDLKLNRIEKHRVQLLLDADGRVVWVVGLRADNRFRLTPDSRHALRLSY